ncbi:MAG: type II toxin-antitoxin system VapC family toxin [bacterium]
MKYLFDTDILSNLMKRNPSSALIERLKDLPPQFQYTSSITVGEMYYGAFKSPYPQLIIKKIEEEVFPSLCGILSFDENTAREYGRIRTELETRGELLAEPDIRIAAISLVNDATLVTGNIKHFNRIKGLRVENWLEG